MILNEDDLRKKVMEVYPSFVFDDELFVDLGRLAIDHMELVENGADDKVLLPFYNMVNEICGTTDEHILNLMNTGIIEILVDTELSQEYAGKYLKGRALGFYEVAVGGT
jgi:hypothetical protein